MLIKATMLIRHRTNAAAVNTSGGREGGWSESVYYNGPDIMDLRAKFTEGGVANGVNLCAHRAALLPIGSAVIGQRYQLLNPVGNSQSTNKVFLAPNVWAADVPQMALLCKAPGVGVANARQLIIRGIPDVMVGQGEFTPTPGFLTALSNYFADLTSFCFRALDLSVLAYPIVNVSANGDVQGVLINVNNFAVGDIVEIRTKTSGGNNLRGLFRVKTVNAMGLGIVVEGWSAGLCVGGFLRRRAIVYPQIDAAGITVGRIIVKKVGRPFDQYRGRRSKVNRW